MKKLCFVIVCFLLLSSASQMLYAQNSANSQWEESKQKAEIQRLKLALETEPDQLSLYVELAEAFIKQKDYSSIVALVGECEKRFTLNEVNGRLLYLKALSLRNIGKYEQAIEVYQHYLGLKQYELEAYIGLALAYEKLGDREQAKLYYGKYLEEEKDPKKNKAILFAKQKIQLLESNVMASDQSVIEEAKDKKETKALSSNVKDGSQAKDKEEIKAVIQDEKNNTKAQDQQGQFNVTKDEQLRKSKEYMLSEEQSKRLGEADALFDQGEYHKANLIYQSLIDMLPNEALAPDQPAILSLLEKGAICAFVDESYEKSQKLSQHLLLYQSKGLPLALAALNYDQLSQNQPLVSINEMRIALKEGRFYHVLELVTLAQAQELAPKNLIEYIKAKALFSLGKYSEALSAYEKAIQQLPHPLLMMDLVHAAMASQQYKVAQQHLESYLNQEQLQNQDKPSRFFVQAQQYLIQIKGKP